MSEASQNLHLTPQALSISMKNLEKELGFSVLDTTFSGTTLTAKGEALAILAEKFLFDIALLKDNDCATAAVEESILFPAAPGINSLFLPQLYDYLTQFPANYKISFSAYSPEILIQKVQDGEIPYGFLYQTWLDGQPLVDIADLRFYEIKKFNLKAVLHKQHPLAHYKKVSLKSLLKYPWVNITNAKLILEGLFAKIGNPPTVSMVPTTNLLPVFLNNNPSAVLLHYLPGAELNAEQFVFVNLKESFTSSLIVVVNKTMVLQSRQLQNHLTILVNFFRTILTKDAV